MQKNKIIERKNIYFLKKKHEKLKGFQVQEVTRSHSEEKEHSKHTKFKDIFLCLLFTLKKI